MQTVAEYDGESCYFRTKRETEDCLAKDVRIVGSHPSMMSLYNLIANVGPTFSNVVIYGETGVGKELVARALHKYRENEDDIFATVNCAAIPRELFESELFGHVKGAYTGAHKNRTGTFEYAQRGTAFLDEVSELPLDIQAKLLRVIQQRKVKPVGANSEKDIECRLVFATNRSLIDLVEKGEFRSDLFYRLDVMAIRVPSLRQRKSDVYLLAKYFLDKYRNGNGEISFGEDAIKKMTNYEWPGNIRELENVVQRAMILSEGENIKAKHIITGPMDPTIVTFSKTKVIHTNGQSTS